MTNTVKNNNVNLFFLEDEGESGSEQEGSPRTYTKEEEKNLLKSDSKDMDIDGESFHSAHEDSPWSAYKVVSLSSPESTTP